MRRGRKEGAESATVGAPAGESAGAGDLSAARGPRGTIESLSGTRTSTDVCLNFNSGNGPT